MNATHKSFMVTYDVEDIRIGTEVQGWGAWIIPSSSLESSMELRHMFLK